MSNELVIGCVHLVPLDANAQKLFGFSEYLTSLALMAIVWTIADVRYRFRVMTNHFVSQKSTFYVIVAVGVLTLLTDLWCAEGWLVPKWGILTLASWQAILGAVFLFTFVSWAWFAFVKPPIYNKNNAKRYAQTLYRFILKGSSAELSVIADELSYSAKSLVKYATDKRTRDRFRNHKQPDAKPVEKIPEVTAYANDILFLIADKRLCRAIVDSSPGTALAVFREVSDTKKYGVPIETFAHNIVNEALENKNSFLYHETEGYESGLIGHHKPLSQAMFSNHKMVEVIGRLLDPEDMWNWDSEKWKAYCRVVLLTFEDYVESEFCNHSFVLYRAKGYIENAVIDLHKINGTSTAAWENDAVKKLRIAVSFVKDAVEILDKKGPPDHIRLRIREKHRNEQTFYDYLAEIIVELIFHASAVNTPSDLCWMIQHNMVWHELFNFGKLDGPAGKIVKFKVRRLIYDEIAEMTRFPNFKSAKFLGFCLNVMGLALSGKDYDRDSKALHKAVLSWTKKNYAWLHSYNVRVAEACLVDGITYDSKLSVLTKTFPAENLRREAEFIRLPVEPRTDAK